MLSRYVMKLIWISYPTNQPARKPVGHAAYSFISTVVNQKWVFHHRMASDVIRGHLWNKMTPAKNSKHTLNKFIKYFYMSLWYDLEMKLFGYWFIVLSQHRCETAKPAQSFAFILIFFLNFKVLQMYKVFWIKIYVHPAGPFQLCCIH